MKYHIDFINSSYRRFYAEHRDKILLAIDKCYRNGDFVLRKELALFEKNLAKFIRTKYCYGVGSGTDALKISYKALGLKPGDEVITVSHVFIAPIEEIVHLGATPILIDVGVDGLMNPDLIEKAITKKTVGIVPIHLSGKVCDMTKIMKIARKHRLWVVEDACFVAGTKVLTLEGNKNIENIKVGDLVLTRQGYKQVLASEMTGIKKVIKKLGITATPNHPFITKKGEKRFDALKGCDILYKWNEKLSCIEERSITDIQNQRNETKESISTGTILISLQNLYIGKYGLTIMAKSLKDLLFIIKMKILSITIFRILNYLPILSTAEGTHMKKYTLAQNLLQPLYATSILVERKQMLGIEAQEALQWEEKMPTSYGIIKKLKQNCVRFVEKSIKLSGLSDQNFAQKFVNQRDAAVYNLTVEDSHEFFANNILVHNCQALGAKHKGKMAGSFGDTGCFSHIAPKTLGIGGDGGTIVTNNKELATSINLLRNHWNITQGVLHGHQPVQPKIMGWGYNSRLDNIHAAVLNIKLKLYPKMLKRRREIGMRYNKGLQVLEDLELIQLPIQQKEQIYQEYIVKIPRMWEFKQFMDKAGIELLIRDTTPNHQLKGLGLEHFNLPVTEALATSSVRLPTYPELRDEEVNEIIKAMYKFFGPKATGIND